MNFIKEFVLVEVETVIKMRRDNIVVIFQMFAIISHNPTGKSAFNYFDSSFQAVWSILTGFSQHPLKF